jgi:hypothetical protein
MSHILNWASQINSIPLLSRLSPRADRIYSENEKTGHKATQRLAQNCVQEISALIKAGWTEKQTANLMETWLRDHGVKAFFHKPFVWWGDRTRFDGVKNYWDYLPTETRLAEDEVFILDVAPILNGYVADIGFSGCYGQNKEYSLGIKFLEELRRELPKMAIACIEGFQLWEQIDQLIVANGYENIHATYPFGVLGHRLHKNPGSIEATFIHFGWQSYWDLLSRGLFGQLLNKNFSGSLVGLWAIEPHIGTKDFGLKFEEILVVEKDKAYWLEESANFHSGHINLRNQEEICHH